MPRHSSPDPIRLGAWLAVCGCPRCHWQQYDLTSLCVFFFFSFPSQWLLLSTSFFSPPSFTDVSMTRRVEKLHGLKKVCVCVWGGGGGGHTDTYNTWTLIHTNTLSLSPLSLSHAHARTRAHTHTPTHTHTHRFES